MHIKKNRKTSIPYFFNLQILLSKENNLLGNFRKIFKGSSHYCQRLPDHKILSDRGLWKNLENPSLKRWFFHKIFGKCHINVGKMKIPKMGR